MSAEPRCLVRTDHRSTAIRCTPTRYRNKMGCEHCFTWTCQEICHQISSNFKLGLTDNSNEFCHLNQLSVKTETTEFSCQPQTVFSIYRPILALCCFKGDHECVYMTSEAFATEAALTFTLGGVTIKFLNDSGFPKPLLDRCQNDTSLHNSIACDFTKGN